MAKGFKHGADGGSSLNFKVICNPQTSTAKENTIWVDTDRINNYYFSATQPENMVEYDVWFTIGTSSTVAFNALKKNGIQVYPLSAKQYIGGTWVDKTAKSWQGGAWVDWIPEGALFWLGYDNTEITGGWFKTYNTQGSGGTFTMNEGSITVTAANGTAATQCGCMTNNSINLTGKNTLKVNVTQFSGTPSGNIGQVLIFSSKGAPFNASNIILDREISGSNPGTYSFDVSSLSSGYISILAMNKKCSMTFDKVWTE